MGVTACAVADMDEMRRMIIKKNIYRNSIKRTTTTTTLHTNKMRKVENSQRWHFMYAVCKCKAHSYILYELKDTKRIAIRFGVLWLAIHIYSHCYVDANANANANEMERMGDCIYSIVLAAIVYLGTATKKRRYIHIRNSNMRT